MTMKAKVLILGTFHFANGGEHMINVEGGDITSEQKQEEIREVVQKLLEFKPTKIAVESRKAKSRELNEAYLDYCLRDSNITSEVISHRNEIVQLGFRLGKMLNHPKIYPIDYPVNLPDELYEYAEKNYPTLYRKFMKEINEYGTTMSQVMKNNSIIEILRYFNNAERINNEHSNLYLYMAQIGAGDNYCGADMLTEWYRRNLRIFGNLQSIAKPDDRILVIYGAGHCKILKDLVSEYKDFELVDTLDYL
jgi:hypothetical protein